MSRLTLDQQVRIHVDLNSIIFVRTLENFPSAQEQRQLPPRKAKFSMWGYVRWGPEVFSSGTWSAEANPDQEWRNKAARGIHAELSRKILEHEAANPQTASAPAEEEPRGRIILPPGYVHR